MVHCEGALRRKMATVATRMVSFLIFVTFFSALCVAQSNPASSPQDSSARLDSITATGSKRFSASQIATATGLQVGAMVTRDDLQNAANRLSRLGPFATVRYRYGTSDTSANLEFQVTDARSLPVTFDNFPWLSDDEIAQALKSSVVLFDGTAPENGTILDDMSAALEKLLSGKGVQASVSHQVTSEPAADSANDQRVQQFHAEDVDIRINSVNFSDPLANSDRGIQSSLANLVGSPYSRSDIEIFEFEQVRPVYLARGFLRVRFAPPVAHLEAVPANSTSPPSRVAVSAAIDTGPTYAWNGVTWMGNSAIRSAQLDPAIALKPGDLADGTKIGAAWDRARDLYGRLGFLDVKLDVAPHFDDAAKRVSYVVTITEGQQYRMGNLVISGLSMDGERRLRDAWKIPLGSLFDEGAYDQFLDTGVKEAFAGLPIHYEKIGRFLQENSKAGTVDVLLDFQ